mmetsp:Transcript_103665/g.292993  ORF Transcript_103665/g.292993 Transcript_103665/m.292993 type:complete len:330 (-) Transcript_103665:28-1017(-)
MLYGSVGVLVGLRLRRICHWLLRVLRRLRKRQLCLLGRLRRQLCVLLRLLLRVLLWLRLLVLVVPGLLGGLLLVALGLLPAASCFVGPLGAADTHRRDREAIVDGPIEGHLPARSRGRWMLLERVESPNLVATDLHAKVPAVESGTVTLVPEINVDVQAVHLPVPFVHRLAVVVVGQSRERAVDNVANDLVPAALDREPLGDRSGLLLLRLLLRLLGVLGVLRVGLRWLGRGWCVAGIGCTPICRGLPGVVALLRAGRGGCGRGAIVRAWLLLGRRGAVGVIAIATAGRRSRVAVIPTGTAGGVGGRPAALPSRCCRGLHGAANGWHQG